VSSTRTWLGGESCWRMRQIQAPLRVTGILLAVAWTGGGFVHAESPRVAPRACWEPPPLDHAHRTLWPHRLGRVFGKVAVTFESHSAPTVIG
jgi:hypothetical protein